MKPEIYVGIVIILLVMASQLAMKGSFIKSMLLGILAIVSLILAGRVMEKKLK